MILHISNKWRLLLNTLKDGVIGMVHAGEIYQLGKSKYLVVTVVAVVEKPILCLVSKRRTNNSYYIPEYGYVCYLKCRIVDTNKLTNCIGKISDEALSTIKDALIKYC